MIGRQVIATLACVGAAGLGCAPVGASAKDEWHFTNCTGTPSTFTATHQASNGASWRLIDGTATFAVKAFEDLTAGKEFIPPGHESSGLLEITCTVVNPFTGHTLRLTGFFTPR